MRSTAAGTIPSHSHGGTGTQPGVTAPGRGQEAVTAPAVAIDKQQALSHRDSQGDACVSKVAQVLPAVAHTSPAVSPQLQIARSSSPPKPPDSHEQAPVPGERVKGKEYALLGRDNAEGKPTWVIKKWVGSGWHRPYAKRHAPAPIGNGATASAVQGSKRPYPRLQEWSKTGCVMAFIVVVIPSSTRVLEYPR